MEGENQNRFQFVGMKACRTSFDVNLASKLRILCGMLCFDLAELIF